MLQGVSIGFVDDIYNLQRSYSYVKRKKGWICIPNPREGLLIIFIMMQCSYVLVSLKVQDFQSLDIRNKRIGVAFVLNVYYSLVVNCK